MQNSTRITTPVSRKRRSFSPDSSRVGVVTMNACAVAVALALGGAAQAQDGGPADGAARETVLVTGSRIRATGFQTPTPVTSVTADELDLMAPGNLIESMTQLPMFVNNSTQDDPGSFFSGPGSGSLNIRGLNTNRTLTLLNGRRMTPSNRIGSVDINSFPESLVSRVEVVTGGASAAYGTNAVAGVANFILDTEFNGLKTHIQTGNSSSNSRGTWEGSAAFGTEIGENGHLIVSGEVYEQDAVNGYNSQSWWQGWGQVRDTSVPGSRLDLVVPNVVSTQGSQNGVINAPAGSALNGWEFRSDGTAGPFVFGSPVGNGNHSIAGGGSGTPNGTERATLSPKAERNNLFLYYDHDLNDSTNVYAQVTRGQNTSRSNNLGGVFTGASNGLTVFSGNAFLPANVQTIMDNESLESFSFQRFGSPLDLAFGEQETENTSSAITLGFEKDISADGMLDGWQVRGYLQSGTADHIGRHINGIRIDRIPASLDAVDDGSGNIVCYAALQDPANWSDCVPTNFFGAGNMSQASIDYLTGLDVGTVVSNEPVFFSGLGYSTGRTISYTSGADKITDTKYTQELIEFSLDGQIAEGWAGPISAAFGVHYREEDILQLTNDHTNPSGDFASRPAQFDPTIVRGVGTGMSERTTAIQFASVPNLKGGFDVTEAFAEFIVPLVVDKPGFDNLTASVAWRWADYEPSGSIIAYKGGLDWQVNDLLRVRTTVSRDVRAATLAERLDRTGGVANIEDRFFGAGMRFDTSLASGGNPNLKPEEADTVTAGLIFQPRNLSGFQASVDYYDIDISGAVGQLGIQALVDECFDNPASATCNLVTRDPNTNVIVLVENVFVNINAARTTGFDFEAAYRADVGPGSLGWRFLATIIEENSITNLGAAKVDFAGDVGTQEFPDLKFTTNLTYNQGPFTAFLQARFIDSGLYNARDIQGVTISDNTVDSVLYTDARVSYGKDLSNGSRWEVFGSITNLFDEDPPIVPGFSSFTGQTSQVNNNVHDILGRRYTVGFRYEL